MLDFNLPQIPNQSHSITTRCPKKRPISLSLSFVADHQTGITAVPAPCRQLKKGSVKGTEKHAFSKSSSSETNAAGAGLGSAGGRWERGADEGDEMKPK